MAGFQSKSTMIRKLHLRSILFAIFSVLVIFFMFTKFLLQQEHTNSDNYIAAESNVYIDTASKTSRVVCIVLARLSELSTKSKAVYETWGKRCDFIEFIVAAAAASQINTNIPILQVPLQYETGDTRSMSGKLFEGLRHVYEKYSKLTEIPDWYYVCDDDTYVIVENLKKFMAEKEISGNVDKETYGYNFGADFQSGGSGILMHRKVLEKFVDHYKINCQFQGPGDVMLSSCFKQLGIGLGRSRDEKNLDRFFPLNVNHGWQSAGAGASLTINCCSESAISFHYINPYEMVKFDILLYKIKINKT